MYQLWQRRHQPARSLPAPQVQEAVYSSSSDRRCFWTGVEPLVQIGGGELVRM